MNNHNISVSAPSSYISNILWLILAITTAKIGYQIHDSIFWSIVDFFFFPIAWLKWLLCDEVNMSIIRAAFNFFLS